MQAIGIVDAFGDRTLESLKAKLIADESSFFRIHTLLIRWFCFSRIPSEAASPSRRCSQPAILPLDLAGLRAASLGADLQACPQNGRAVDGVAKTF